MIDWLGTVKNLMFRKFVTGRIFPVKMGRLVCCVSGWTLVQSSPGLVLDNNPRGKSENGTIVCKHFADNVRSGG